MLSRRQALSMFPHACTATLAANLGATAVQAQEQANDGRWQKFFIFTMVGSENPTRANFPFVWAAALHEAGHEVRIELAGDATVLMRDVVVTNTSAVGWPPMKEAVDKVTKYKIPVYV